ncbi:hypothetical protein GTW64_22400 [Streptomyces sp. SID4923]|nr:hypothetical protein [Streptomyces sp. SID4923]
MVADVVREIVGVEGPAASGRGGLPLQAVGQPRHPLGGLLGPVPGRAVADMGRAGPAHAARAEGDQVVAVAQRRAGSPLTPDTPGPPKLRTREPMRRLFGPVASKRIRATSIVRPFGFR